MGEKRAVVSDLVVQVDFSGVEKVAIVRCFDEALQPQCDEQADGDGEEMHEEVANAVDRMFGRMDFHGLDGLLIARVFAV